MVEEITGSGVDKNLTQFAKQHFESAKLFAKLSDEVETAYTYKKEHDTQPISDEYFRQFLTQKRAYVTASIFSSVAFLEATVNEFFINVSENPSGLSTQRLDDNFKAQIKTLWDDFNLVERLNTLDKFKLVLSLLPNKPIFNTGRSPYQDVYNLIKIRNHLVHFKPEWFGGYGGSGEDNKFFSQLSKKFSNSLFPDNPAFDKCLCSECAHWAVKSTEEFVNDFLKKIDQ